MLTELHFLRQIRLSPEDDLSRLIYADWLEEQGDARADFLRLDVELQNRTKESLDYQELLAERSSLLPQIDPAWVNLLAKAAIEKCARSGRRQQANPNEAEGVDFAYRCPKRWEKQGWVMSLSVRRVTPAAPTCMYTRKS